MELLIAMFSGAVGAVSAPRFLRRAKGGLWPTTFLGILGGAAAWQVLALVGPGVKAGPLVAWHIGAGMLSGAALALLVRTLRARIIG